MDERLSHGVLGGYTEIFRAASRPHKQKPGHKAPADGQVQKSINKRDSLCCLLQIIIHLIHDQRDLPPVSLPLSPSLSHPHRKRNQQRVHYQVHGSWGPSPSGGLSSQYRTSLTVTQPRGKACGGIAVH